MSLGCRLRFSYRLRSLASGLCAVIFLEQSLLLLMVQNPISLFPKMLNCSFKGMISTLSAAF